MANKPNQDDNETIAKNAEAEAAATAKAAELQAQADTAAEKGAVRYRVAKGLSITSLRGIIEEGEPVSERDFVHGKTDLDQLVARGAVVRS